MKQLKFRIWNKRTKKFTFLDLEGPYEYCESNEWNIFQQSTGLFDKNYKDIYEGDLVKTDPNHFTNIMKADENIAYTKGEIKWLREGFEVCQWGAKFGATKLSDYSSCDCHPCGLEVIGNIMENPE